MKKAFKITFFVSLAIIVLLSVIIAVSVVSASKEHTSSVGIIGGADGPTAIFVTRTLVFQNPIFMLLCASFALVIVSAVGWAVSKK